MKTTPFHDPAVKAVFEAYPFPLQVRLFELRELIFATARKTGSVGELVETLKWQQPAYLTQNPKTGSTIRIDALKDEGQGYAMFFHCQTNLVATLRELYSDRFRFEGSRAIHFRGNEKIPVPELKHCIALALTYHLRH